MIKSELVQKLAEENPHLYQRDVENIVNAILDEIGDALAKGDRVELRGFGAFSVKNRPARIGRNPRTGEQVEVSEKYAPQFKAGKDIRERLEPLSAAAGPRSAKMLKRIVGWLVLAPLSLFLVLFALANRTPVAVSIDPFGAEAPFAGPYSVPLFVVIYLMLVLGIVLGGAAVWFAQGHNRREKRRWRREAERLGRELAARPAQDRDTKGLVGTDDYLDIE